ncbi:MAG: NAD(P)-dependent oxidoreductase, partial [Acidobacteria bacterium]|nr:NAD(P)-dependent oxidoreductase [Acidobacteriota bacterium]
GTALAQRLLAAGFSVFVFDPSSEARMRIESIGGKVLASEAEVARQCRRLILSLPGPKEVLEVMNTISGDLRSGDVILDTTTGDPESVEKLCKELEARGVSYLDATLGGSSRQISAGEAIVLCGSSPEAFTATEDLLAEFGRQVFHTGATGSGTRMKLVLNLVLGLQRAVLAEGLAFAGKSGVDPQLALEILKAGPAYARVMDTKGKRMLSEDFQPEARLAQHWKDVGLMQQSARSNGAKIPLTDLHEKLLRGAVDAGWGGEDNSAIIKVFY